ncbi:hypothetical protein FRX31_030546 [Thalictrum thalictroides]|uniref:Uncharacterized protein n=1 Tax=Thalictrum thalictroides TaxID=46969 RepID=A0A7J6V477_THATH|nr:hypothetical protein FRX31_030546 [Thalictrum thalictroides]
MKRQQIDNWKDPEIQNGSVDCTPVAQLTLKFWESHVLHPPRKYLPFGILYLLIGTPYYNLCILL